MMLYLRVVPTLVGANRQARRGDATACSPRARDAYTVGGTSPINFQRADRLYDVITDSISA